MQELLQSSAMAVSDRIMAAVPRPVPDELSLRNCRIISHRGEHDNRTVIENTFPAFERAREAGVWGLECDLRWTADLVPLVCHDPDGSRLFGCSEPFRTLPFEEVRARMPTVPTLAELVSSFGGSMHLMLEIKAEPCVQPELQKRLLEDHLYDLIPGRDYHFLALDPGLYERVDFVAPQYFFPVSELNVRQLSAAAIEGQFGGLTGHYALLSNNLKQRHAAAGQRIGTGFVGSRNCLYRELNRGVEWIFSNDAVKIQRIVNQCLGE